MKRRCVTLCIVLLLTLNICGQTKYSTKGASITFEASVPSFEEVKATNNNVGAIFNSETAELAVLALMKGFRFKVALMEEHFNENYVESSRYPKAVFKGSIEGFDWNAVSDSAADYFINGSISLHGETKQIRVPLQLMLKDDKLHITTEFILIPSDFNIKIPAVVRSKIANEVNVSVQLILSTSQ